MANLTIRDVSDDLHRWLRERAAANHRSLNKEVIVQLEALRQPMPAGGDSRQRLAGIRAVASRSVRLRVRDTRPEEDILGYPKA